MGRVTCSHDDWQSATPAPAADLQTVALMTADRRTALAEAFEAYKRGRFQLALERYTDLANEGDADSQVQVGWMHAEGVGCVKNIEVATDFLSRAAARGNPRGQFYLARLLSSQGKHDAALPLYRQAAARDYLPAVFRVGHSLVYAKGTAADMEEGVKWLTLAAGRGHAYAMRDLAVQEMRGRCGWFALPLGAARFCLAIVWGTWVYHSDKHSEQWLA